LVQNEKSALVDLGHSHRLICARSIHTGYDEKSGHRLGTSDSDKVFRQTFDTPWLKDNSKSSLIPLDIASIGGQNCVLYPLASDILDYSDPSQWTITELRNTSDAYTTYGAAAVTRTGGR
jgi:hypothetical protein